MSNFRKALIYTAIPIVILSLISLFGRSTDFTEGIGVTWLFAGGLWVISVLTAIGFTIKKRDSIGNVGRNFYRVSFPSGHLYC